MKVAVLAFALLGSALADCKQFIFPLLPFCLLLNIIAAFDQTNLCHPSPKFATLDASPEDRREYKIGTYHYFFQ